MLLPIFGDIFWTDENTSSNHSPSILQFVLNLVLRWGNNAHSYETFSYFCFFIKAGIINDLLSSVTSWTYCKSSYAWWVLYAWTYKMQYRQEDWEQNIVFLQCSTLRYHQITSVYFHSNFLPNIFLTCIFLNCTCTLCLESRVPMFLCSITKHPD